MTYLDWIIIALTLWFVVQGVVKGALAVLLTSLAIVVCYVVAAILMPTLGEGVARALLGSIKSLPPGWARLAGFVVPFVLGYGLLSLLISILPGGKQPVLQAQVLGIFVGLIKALVASMALMGILLASPSSEAIM